jgi:glutathione S-transferase
MRAVWMLEEAGCPYERVLVDIRKGGQDDPAFRKDIPMGVPPSSGRRRSILRRSAHSLLP